MVFVKVRETYDLKTVSGKMTVIGVKTPKPQILKDNFPGLLMQCKSYRPVSCDVRVACASTMPLDPQGVGTTAGDVAPEDLFNPILYKATTNVGMSQIEARINALTHRPTEVEVDGNTAIVDTDSVTNRSDEFDVYYGLLSNCHGWKHANPQAGLEMRSLKPLVFEMLYNVGDNGVTTSLENNAMSYPDPDGVRTTMLASSIRGNAKPIPMINCTAYTGTATPPGFPNQTSGDTVIYAIHNAETEVPYIDCMCACIIVPPSRLHELFYRMVVEWTIEFSSIRPIGEITNWSMLAQLGSHTHYKNYSYTTAKTALTGDSDTILTEETNMVSSNVDIKKVM